MFLFARRGFRILYGSKQYHTCYLQFFFIPWSIDHDDCFKPGNMVSFSWHKTNVLYYKTADDCIVPWRQFCDFYFGKAGRSERITLLKLCLKLSRKCTNATKSVKNLTYNKKQHLVIVWLTRCCLCPGLDCPIPESQYLACIVCQIWVKKRLMSLKTCRLCSFIIRLCSFSL